MEIDRDRYWPQIDEIADDPVSIINERVRDGISLFRARELRRCSGSEKLPRCGPRVRHCDRCASAVARSSAA